MSNMRKIKSLAVEKRDLESLNMAAAHGIERQLLGHRDTCT